MAGIVFLCGAVEYPFFIATSETQRRWLVLRFRGWNQIDASINLVQRSAHVILRRACPTWGARLEGLRASRRTATSETEPAAILARSVPTSAANGLKKSARSAALECYDAARKARCIP